MGAPLNLAQFGKEKRYDLYPQLLDLHVERLTEASRLAPTYINDTELLHTGIIRHEKFLGSHTGIEQEILDSVIKDGQCSESRVINLSGPSRHALPKLWEQIKPLFPDHMLSEVSQHFCSNTYLQHLLNTPEDNDEQKVFHSDTFFHAVKFWYFPKAVTEGAFWYVPNSPILTPELIDWHADRVADIKAGKAESWRRHAHLEGSFRISPEELKELGYMPVSVTVDDDTLVIANTFGFHRRGDTTKPTHRAAIHGSIRINNPFAHVS